MFYSKSTGGFYDHAIHGDNIPADTVEISRSTYESLLEGQSKGKIISSDEAGYPILETPPDPPVVVPSVVSMRQTRLALFDQGLLGDVAPAIASLPSPMKEKAEIEWEFSKDVERSSTLVSLMGAALNLTEEDLDNLFSLAITL